MKMFLVFIAICMICSTALAELAVATTATQSIGNKAVVTLGLTNSFSDKIESARATVFLMDPAGKVIGQGTRWIIGGSPEKPGLDAKAGTVFHFVIETGKPFATNRVFVNRIVLSGGKVILPLPPSENRTRE